MKFSEREFVLLEGVLNRVVEHLCFDDRPDHGIARITVWHEHPQLREEVRQLFFRIYRHNHKPEKSCEVSK